MIKTLFGIAIALVAAYAYAQGAHSGGVGKYQLATAGNTIIRIDTQNGAMVACPNAHIMPVKCENIR